MSSLAIRGPHGDLPIYCAAPTGTGRFPGVVVIHDAGGMSHDLRHQADWLASEGFLAAAPSLYHWGTMLTCIRQIMREMRARHGRAFDEIDAVRTWLAHEPHCTGMQGFAFAAGKRDDQVIRAIRLKSLSTPFGELDGSTTPRLTRLVAILRDAGFNATTSAHMTDWLATHAALVAPVGMLTLKHRTDTYALGRSRDDLRLLVDASREVLAVLHKNGRRIVPISQNVIRWLPRFIVIVGVRRLLSTRFGEIGLGWHCSQAPDEIQALAREVLVLVDKSGLPAPALRTVLSPATGSLHQVSAA